MHDNLTLISDHNNYRQFNLNMKSYLVGIFAVLAPLGIVGLIGDSLGSDTSFASGLVINLAYVLAIASASIVLKLQGRGWRALGLARPASWPKTIAISLGTLLAMVAGVWTVVTFGEEMLFRAFLITSLGGLFGNLKNRWALALAGSSVLFGLAHHDWGIAGINTSNLPVVGTVLPSSNQNPPLFHQSSCSSCRRRQ